MKRGITVEKRSAVISFCFPCPKNETRFSSVTHSKQRKAIFIMPMIDMFCCTTFVRKAKKLRLENLPALKKHGRITSVNKRSERNEDMG